MRAAMGVSSPGIAIALGHELIVAMLEKCMGGNQKKSRAAAID